MLSWCQVAAEECVCLCVCVMLLLQALGLLQTGFSTGWVSHPASTAPIRLDSGSAGPRREAAPDKY